jgi:hypothetical protein
MPTSTGPQARSGRGSITVIAHGTPAGQGRISFRGRGRGAYHSNEKQLLPWRQAIIDAALAATGRHVAVDPYDRGECALCRIPVKVHALLVGVPVAADITITVEKPKSAPKTRRTYPITRSSTDIDHHARACLDAISQSGIIHDDSQVVDLTIRKVYPGEHDLALTFPGAVIKVRQIGGGAR